MLQLDPAVDLSNANTSRRQQPGAVHSCKQRNRTEICTGETARPLETKCFKGSGTRLGAQERTRTSTGVTPTGS